MPTSEELLELAARCAERLEEEGYLRHVPSFSDAEEQCEAQYESLLQAIHEDELFAPVDIQRQEQLVQRCPKTSARSSWSWPTIMRAMSGFNRKAPTTSASP
jgi:hypothetical protein